MKKTTNTPVTCALNRERATLTANKRLPYPAYVSARDIALAHEGTIGETADGLFTATFSKVANAKACQKAWTDAYEQARSERAQATEPAPAPAPKKPRSTKKGNGKAVDFSKVKGATKSDRNKAAHALIMSMGVESGSKEYNALWKQWQSVR